MLLCSTWKFVGWIHWHPVHWFILHFRRLNDTFGKCGHPHIGWQIDPFGHSRGMAAIFAELGFDGLLFGRLDYQDKLNRLTKKTAEMIWEGSPNLGKNIFDNLVPLW